MPTFANTLNPTPFGFFDNDGAFITEADAIVIYVKRKLGDDILSVELTKKQIWACLEESLLEYGSIVNTYQAQSQMMDMLGFPTGSSLSGSTNIGPNSYEQMLPRSNLDFLDRLAEPYAQEAGLGGSYNTASGSIKLIKDQQDYDIYTDLKDAHGGILFQSASLNPLKTKIKVMEVYHFSPQAAYRFFDTTSAINYLNNEFSFESFTPETIFYVLPVFEDILRAGQLNLSSRVRRSNYSYKIMGTKIRIFPRPTQDDPKKLWLRVGFNSDPFNAAYKDKTKFGTSNLSNIPYGNLQLDRLNSIGRQWIRQYAYACSKEVLGLVRSKFGSVPIADAELSLNGDALITQAREEKSELKTTLKEILDKMTYTQLVVAEADKSDAIMRLLRNIPMPVGKSILIG